MSALPKFSRTENPIKKKAKEDKKARARINQDGVQKSRVQQRQKIKDLNVKRDKLQKDLESATEEDKIKINGEIDTIMGEIGDNEKIERDQQVQEDQFKQDELDADKEDEFDYLPMEMTDAPPLNTTEYDPAKLIADLKSGRRLNDSKDPFIPSRRVGLRDTEAVIGYKSTGYGKIGLVVDTQFEDAPIYRIRKNVIINEDVPCIKTNRRAGVCKDQSTKENWSHDDVQEVKGIAISVPPGYPGNVEDLLIVQPKLTPKQREELKLAKKLPKLVDVQLLIQWSKEINGQALSWESRTGCRTIWKKAGDETIYDAAKRFEKAYREQGGKYAVPPAGSTASPEVTPDPDQLPSTKTTPGGTPGPDQLRSTTITPGGTPEPNAGGKTSGATSKEKADAWGVFRSEWCDEKGLDSKNLSDADYARSKVIFTLYWEDLQKRAKV